MSDTIQTPPASRAPLSLVLVALGLLGAASFFFSNLPIPPEYADMFTPETFRLQTTIGPTILVLIAGVLGHIFAHRAGLSAPFLASLFAGRPDLRKLGTQALWASLSAAVLLGVALSISPLVTLAGIEAEMAALNAFSNDGLHPATKLLYGAFAEEIIMRWGLFSLVAFGSLKLIGSFSRESALVFAVVVTSLIANAIHAPTLGHVLGTPPAMLVLLVQGIGFLASVMACDLYMRRGLEAAILFKLFLIIVGFIAVDITLPG